MRYTLTILIACAVLFAPLGTTEKLAANERFEKEAAAQTDSCQKIKDAAMETFRRSNLSDDSQKRKVIESYQRILECDPDDEYAISTVVNFQLDLHDYQAALTMVNSHKQWSPAEFIEIALLEEAGDTATARDNLLLLYVRVRQHIDSIEINPSRHDPMLYYSVARKAEDRYQMQGNRDEVSNVILEIIRRHLSKKSKRAGYLKVMIKSLRESTIEQMDDTILKRN